MRSGRRMLSSSSRRSTTTAFRVPSRTRLTGCRASRISHSRRSRWRSSRLPVACSGARMQYHLRQAMIFLNAFSFGTPEIFVGQAPTKFDEKTLELKDEITKKLVAQQLAGFAKFIERVKA